MRIQIIRDTGSEYGYNPSTVTVKQVNYNVKASWEHDNNVYQGDFYIMICSMDNVPQDMTINKTSIITKGKYIEYIVKEEIISSSETLQPIVAKWYKALRVIALVGLLSVLVYIGIRILISSTGQEKAKYKKMIGNWLFAICLLFILQYIMILILEISDAITGILSQSVMKQNGVDNLMSTARDNLIVSTALKTSFSKLVIYLVLVIYTLLFTVQYLKRVLYMAFFTMIAPLITLTYPLDKIKDGQAQAFTVWLREYIFNALLQPMHMLLYCIFVTSASELATSNWVYAIVAIGFLLPAEKFFRKMFGFDKAESSGQLGAAAGGALAMNAINSLNSSSKNQTTEECSGGGSPQTPPRYIRAPGTESGDGGTNPPGRRTGGGANPSGRTGGGANPSRRTGRGANPSGRSTSGGTNPPGRSTAFGKTIDQPTQRGRMNLANGAKTLAGHYVNRANAKKLGKGIIKGAVKGTIGITTAAAFGTVGLAIGTATRGNLGETLGYTAAGLGTGFGVGNNLADKAIKTEKKNREIFKKGALGPEEYELRNLIKELTDDNDFNSTCKTLGIKDQKGREKVIRQFRNNGIKSEEDIKKVINARVKAKASQEEVIAAYKIKKQAQRDGLKTVDIRKRLISQNIEDEDVKYVMSIIDML